MMRAHAAVGGCRTDSTRSVRPMSCRRCVEVRIFDIASLLEGDMQSLFRWTAGKPRPMATIDTFDQFDLRCNINEILFQVMERAPVPATPATTSRSAFPASEFVIEASGVNHAYEGQKGWVQALENFEIAIPRNEFMCLLGPSGCGKSSFLRIVTGLMKPLEGEVRLNGKRIEEPGLDRGIVFQEPALFPWLTALRNVAFGLEMNGMDKPAVNERAAAVLKIVGLERAKHLYPFQLSGGMKHRVAVARAWALPNASVLLMDEPFAAIDAI